MFRRWGKFNNQGAVYKGRLFHSRKERDYAILLDGLVNQGEVLSWDRQVTFRLYGKNGGFICKYIADYMVRLPSGKQEVHEVKGYADKTWPIKKKLFEDNYPDLELKVIR